LTPTEPSPTEGGEKTLFARSFNKCFHSQIVGPFSPKSNRFIWIPPELRIVCKTF
jgi:hypothetical protein